MNFIGASILIVLISVVFCTSRRTALLGMMAGVLYITQGQQIQVFGLHLFADRFLELAGFIRVMARREFVFQQLNRIDFAVLLLYCYTTVVFLLRSSEGVAYQVGVAVDAFLCYFAFRGLMANIEDLEWFLRGFLMLLAPYTLLVLFESFTRHNLFSAMGAVADGTWVRGNRIRCFGSFRQPDTLGMFAASFFPLYIGLACIAKERKRAVLGVLLCLAIIWAANSGGAASAAAIGSLGWLLWRVRTQMRKVRWGIVGMIIAVALVMKAPVWYIFAHISSITGGDGWHRSYLIDVAYRHIGQWWFWGMPISETSDWFAYTLGTQNQADITNQFISFGLIAGLPAMALFIFVLVRAYSSLGITMAAVRNDQPSPGPTEFLLWGLGVLLLIHIIDWFGITYFDQMYMVWFMQLATISTICEQHSQAPAKVISEATEEKNISELGHGNCWESF
jgi:hypothetical protein